MAVDKLSSHLPIETCLSTIDQAQILHKSFLEKRPLFKHTMNFGSTIPKIVEEGRELLDEISQPWKGKDTINTIGSELVDLLIFTGPCYGSLVGMEHFKDILREEMLKQGHENTSSRRGRKSNASQAARQIVNDAEDIQRLADWKTITSSTAEIIAMTTHKIARIMSATYLIADMYHIDLDKKVEEKIESNLKRFDGDFFQEISPQYGLTPAQSLTLGYAFHKVFVEQTRGLDWLPVYLNSAGVYSDNFLDLTPNN